MVASLIENTPGFLGREGTFMIGGMEGSGNRDGLGRDGVGC